MDLGAQFGKSGAPAVLDSRTYDLYVVANTDARVFIEQGIAVV